MGRPRDTAAYAHQSGNPNQQVFSFSEATASGPIRQKLWLLYRTISLGPGRLSLLGFRNTALHAHSFPEWASPTDSIKSALRDTTGFLIAAQVGALTIVSLAVGLISIIVGRRGSGATMDVYYNKSLASEVLASSLALLTVLCVQLLWPAQTALHIFGFGSRTLIFKVSLTLIHIVWLVFNLAGLAHFADLSFQFVQPRSRNKFQIRYTANQAVPRQMRHTLSRFLYIRRRAPAFGLGPSTRSALCFWTPIWSPQGNRD